MNFNICIKQKLILFIKVKKMSKVKWYKDVCATVQSNAVQDQ